MTSLNGLATLILSLVALAFVLSLALVYPDHQSTYGPAPAAVVSA